LRESDFDIECEKIIEQINIIVENRIKELESKFNSKLNSLEKRTEIVLNRLAEYQDSKRMYPNLRIGNMVGYSLDEV
jgi:hypothetical protein